MLGRLEALSKKSPTRATGTSDELMDKPACGVAASCNACFTCPDLAQGRVLLMPAPHTHREHTRHVTRQGWLLVGCVCGLDLCIRAADEPTYCGDFELTGVGGPRQMRNYDS